MALLDEVLWQTREQIRLPGSAVDGLLAAQLEQRVVRAHADDGLVEGQRDGVRNHADLLGQTEFLLGELFLRPGDVFAEGITYGRDHDDGDGGDGGDEGLDCGGDGVAEDSG